MFVHFHFLVSGNDDDCKISLKGLGMLKKHCRVLHAKKKGKVLLIGESQALNAIFVNGDKIPARGQVLHHGDRIRFGQNYTFVFVKPSDGNSKQLLEKGDLTWDSAQKEIAEKQGEVVMKTPEELEQERQRY